MIYNLKTYTATAGNYDALLKRFSEKTLPIFKRIGIQVMYCWESEDASNTFYYLTQYENESENEARWNTFSKDEEWIEVKKMSEEQAGGPLLASQHSLTLKSLPFSPNR
jgi:hypothetical protein